MNTTPRRIHVFIALTALCFIPAELPAQTITTGSWTNHFNSASDADSWLYWYGVFQDYLGAPYNLPMTNDPAMDAQGNPGSGSLILFSPFGHAPSPSSRDQNVIFGTFSGNSYDPSLQIPANVIAGLSFDVRVNPGAPLSPSVDFGAIEIVLVPPNWNGNTFNHFSSLRIPAAATNGWIHMVDTNHQDFERFLWNIGTHAAGVGFNYNNYSGYPTNDVKIWLDNVAVHTCPAWALPPPPQVYPGLNILFWMSGQYDREMISAGNQGYSFVGRSNAVYSWTIGNWPSAEHTNFQQHFFLIGDDTGSRGSDANADWNAPNVIFITIQQNASGSATMNFRWKTNEPAGNALIFPTGPNPYPEPFGTLEVPSALGTWSVGFQYNTNVTLTGPNGSTASFLFPAPAAQLFADPMVLFLGGQENGMAGDSMADEGAAITIQRFSAAGVANAFADNFTNDTSLLSPWGNASAEPKDIQIVRLGAAGLPFVPVLSWTNQVSIPYGVVLSPAQLNATANVPGTFAYTPVPGTVLSPGNYVLNVLFTPADGLSYTCATGSVPLEVYPAPLVVTASNASRLYGQTNPPFGGTLVGLTNGDNIIAVYSCSATPANPPGTYPIIPTLVDPDNRLGNYSVTINNGTLTVLTNPVSPSSLVTFQVDMSVAATNGTFNPVTQTVAVQGSFNGWASGLILTNNRSGGNSNLYTGTYNCPTNGVVMGYKFILEPGDVWESPIGNRVALLPSTPGTSLVLPVAWFNNVPPYPLPTNPVTFQVDMVEQIHIGTFTPGSSIVYCRGYFSAWGLDFPLTNNPSIRHTNAFGMVSTNVYVGTYNMAGAPGATMEYKFYIDTGSNWESPLVGDPYDNLNRFFTIEGGPQVLPIVYFSDVPYGPTVTNRVMFQVDLTVERLRGRFDPAQDTVDVRGTFNNWGSGVNIATNNPQASNTNLYTAIVAITNRAGATEQYRFAYSGPNVASGTAWDTPGPGTPQMTGNRYFILADAAAQTLPAVSFSDIAAEFASQPVDLTVTAETQAAFSSLALGAQPLTYQWQFKGTNLVDTGRVRGCNTNTLIIANVRPSDAGHYAVIVTTPYGSVTSDVAILGVTNSGCATCPSGLIAWWSGDNTAQDIVGTNHGILQDDASFAPGIVGQAFAFDGTNGFVEVPDSPTLATPNSMTVETWLKPNVPLSQQLGWPRLVCKYDSLWTNGWILGFNGLDPSPWRGLLVFGVQDGAHPPQYTSPPDPDMAPTNAWTHVAGVFDRSAQIIRIYVNGILEGQTSVGSYGSISSAAPLRIGASIKGWDVFDGLIDEPAVYNRALSANEILAIYAAGPAGKCKDGVAPTILLQPQSQIVCAGATATFSVSSTGSSPLTYRWQVNGTNLMDGAHLSGTSSSILTLTGVLLNDVGVYSVVIANSSGTATSSPATLSVLLADSQQQFSGIQGSNGWYYGYYDGTSASPFSNGDFKQLPTFESGSWVRYNAPGGWWTRLWQDGGHPNGFNQNWGRLAELNWAVRRWVSSVSGFLRVSCTLADLDGGGGNGVVAHTILDGIEISSRTIENGDMAGIVYETSATVSPGSLLDFGMDPRNGDDAFDTTWFTIGITPTLVIEAQPQSQISSTGSTASFHCTAWSSTAISYSWYFNGVPLTNGGSISGALSPDLMISQVQTGHSGTYSLVLSNQYGALTSSSAVLTVVADTNSPVITIQPLNCTNIVGSTATFTVTATGSAPLTFQWIKNGTNVLVNGGNITGATTPTLTLTGVQPADAGLYSARISNAADSTNSDNASLTVLVPCLSVSTDRSSSAMGSALAVNVRSFDCVTSNAIPNVGVVVYVSAGGTTRTIPVTTDSSGQATVHFQPLAGEAGHYAVSAGLPGQSVPAPQAGFSIVGIGFDTNHLTHRLIAGIPVTNHVELRNLTDVPLSQIAVSLLGAPPNVTFLAMTPDTLGGYGTNLLTYVLDSTPGAVDTSCLLQVTSAEGATNSLPLELEFVPPVPQLVVAPPVVYATMTRGKQSVATFSLSNVGGAPSGDLEVWLPEPQPDWLSLVTPELIPSLPPQSSTSVNLLLSPSATLNFGHYTGAVALWNLNAGYLEVPFDFLCDSDQKGNLRVTVVDEFTYYAAGAPKVANAIVTLRDPFTASNVVSAVTDGAGVALFSNLKEGYYDLNVDAADHGSFGTVILVPANQTYDLTAFLPRQMVSYRWIVTTSNIPDRYEFTLDTRFQTEVPAPVVHVEPGAFNLCNYPADTNIVYLNIYNSGLVAAKAATLYFADHPRFAITPLTSNLGDIPARTNLVVPVIIRRLPGTNSGPSSIEAYLDWQLPTGDTTQYYRVPISIYNAGLHDCEPTVVPPPPPWPSGSTLGNGGTGQYPSGGGPVGPPPGGGPGRPIITPPPLFVLHTNNVIPEEVGLRLSQSAILIRHAFTASLEITNGSPDLLTNLQVVIDIRDATNGLANDKFGITLTSLTSLHAVDGTGWLFPYTAGETTWTIVPATNAAPTAPTSYGVGGTLTFQQGTNFFTIPLFHVPIIVYPDARLVVDYFWERLVFSDDPFTTQIEPAVPFGVGVRMKNEGYGTAHAVQITSAQPQIVDNTNGLLIDFQLVGTQVGTQPISPSLTATLGDIVSGSNAIAVWWMTASLHGQFTNFTASFTHLDDLGNGNLSLVQSISNHPLVHVVRGDVPDDDRVPDFLVSDGFPAGTLPDTLYLSDGSTPAVTALTNGSCDAPASPTHTNVLLTFPSPLPAGWTYLRVTNPSSGAPLAFVRRSDGRSLLLGYNVWTTHRLIHPQVGDPYAEDYLHLLDYNSTGSSNSYTLGYSVSLYIVSQPQSRTNLAGSTATFRVIAGGTEPFTYQWLRFGTNLVGATNATLTLTNVQLTDEGPYSVIVSNITGGLPSAEATLTVWVPPVIVAQPQSRTNLVGTPASFTVSATGTGPFTYQWFKDGVLLAGATDAILTIANVHTNDAGSYQVSVGGAQGNTLSAYATLTVLVPPCLVPVPDQSVIVGQQLVITNRGCDPAIPLIFSECAGPDGAIVTTNGIFRWTPTCAQGSTVNKICIQAIVRGLPILSNSVTFVVSVPECIQASLGRTHVLAGQTSSVPVLLLSTTALTNMGFTVFYPSERFTNFTLAVNAPAVLTQWLRQDTPGQVELSFTLASNIVLHGPTNVGRLGFGALSNQGSAFVPLPIGNVTGLKPDGDKVGNYYGQPGRVVVIDREPLLEAWLGTNFLPMLTLYGHPGVSYFLTTTTNVGDPHWLHDRLISLTNLWQTFELYGTYPQLFYRAQEAPPAP